MLREEKKMTQQELADMVSIMQGIKVSMYTIRALEQGQRPITPELLLELAKFFKVNPNELAGERK